MSGRRARRIRSVLDGQSSVSPRNHLRGIVTCVVRGPLMARVEIQAGPHRITSILGVDEVAGLEPGMVAVAQVKATDVVVGRSALT